MCRGCNAQYARDWRHARRRTGRTPGTAKAAPSSPPPMTAEEYERMQDAPPLLLRKLRKFRSEPD